MKKKLAAAAALLTLSAVLAGCGGDASKGGSATDSPEVSGINVTAEVDPEAGTVTLPFDRFAGTDDDSLTVELAYDTALTVCARDHGIPWPATVKYSNDPTSKMWYRFGPWTTQMAEKFAFVRPQSDESLVRNGIVAPPEGYVEPEGGPPGRELGDEVYDEAYDACAQDPDVKRFDGTYTDNLGGPWSDELTQAEDKADKSAEFEDALNDLKACYEGAGLTYDPDRPGYPVGAKEYADSVSSEPVEVMPSQAPGAGTGLVPGTAITEEQVGMALKVADCQQSTDFTQRIADIYAAAQAPVIKKYAAEMTAGREKIDELVADANEYMDSHPQAFEDPE